MENEVYPESKMKSIEELDIIHRPDLEHYVPDKPTIGFSESAVYQYKGTPVVAWFGKNGAYWNRAGSYYVIPKGKRRITK
jgi:hypothetical protein